MHSLRRTLYWKVGSNPTPSKTASLELRLTLHASMQVAFQYSFTCKKLSFGFQICALSFKIVLLLRFCYCTRALLRDEDSIIRSIRLEFDSVLLTAWLLGLSGEGHLGHSLAKHHRHHWGSHHLGSGGSTRGLGLLSLNHVGLHELLLVVRECLLLANNDLLVVLVKLLGSHVRGCSWDLGHLHRHGHLHLWHHRSGSGNGSSDRSDDFRSGSGSGGSLLLVLFFLFLFSFGFFWNNNSFDFGISFYLLGFNGSFSVLFGNRLSLDFSLVDLLLALILTGLPLTLGLAFFLGFLSSGSSGFFGNLSSDNGLSDLLLSGNFGLGGNLSFLNHFSFSDLSGFFSGLLGLGSFLSSFLL